MYFSRAMMFSLLRWPVLRCVVFAHVGKHVRELVVDGLRLSTRITMRGGLNRMCTIIERMLSDCHTISSHCLSCTHGLLLLALLSLLSVLGVDKWCRLRLSSNKGGLTCQDTCTLSELIHHAVMYTMNSHVMISPDPNPPPDHDGYHSRSIISQKTCSK